jgi:hypothetical protein
MKNKYGLAKGDAIEIIRKKFGSPDQEGVYGTYVWWRYGYIAFYFENGGFVDTGAVEYTGK